MMKRSEPDQCDMPPESVKESCTTEKVDSSSYDDSFSQEMCTSANIEHEDASTTTASSSLMDLFRTSRVYDIPEEDLRELLNEEDNSNFELEAKPEAVASWSVGFEHFVTTDADHGGRPSLNANANDASIPEDDKKQAARSTSGTQVTQPIVSFPMDEVRQNSFFFVVSRGGLVSEQPGNRRLRRIIDLFTEPYINARRQDRGVLKQQAFHLLRQQFEFVIQKQVFMRYHERHQSQAVGRQLSRVRLDSILDANGSSIDAIDACDDTDFVRVGEACAFDVVGHLLRDAANELRRKQRLHNHHNHPKWGVAPWQR